MNSFAYRGVVNPARLSYKLQPVRPVAIIDKDRALVLAAANALPESGAISEVIPTDRGVYLVKLNDARDRQEQAN